MIMANVCKIYILDKKILCICTVIHAYSEQLNVASFLWYTHKVDYVRSAASVLENTIIYTLKMQEFRVFLFKFMKYSFKYCMVRCNSPKNGFLLYEDHKKLMVLKLDSNAQWHKTIIYARKWFQWKRAISRKILKF